LYIKKIIKDDTSATSKYSSFSLQTSSLSISEGENKNIMSEFSGVFKKQDVAEV